MKRKTFLLSSILIVLTLAAPVSAAESVAGDRFSASVGIFFTHMDPVTRLAGRAVSGTNTDLETDLGFDASDAV